MQIGYVFIGLVRRCDFSVRNGDILGSRNSALKFCAAGMEPPQYFRHSPPSPIPNPGPDSLALLRGDTRRKRIGVATVKPRTAQSASWLWQYTALTVLCKQRHQPRRAQAGDVLRALTLSAHGPGAFGTSCSHRHTRGGRGQRAPLSYRAGSLLARARSAGRTTQKMPDRGAASGRRDVSRASRLRDRAASALLRRGTGVLHENRK